MEHKFSCHEKFKAAKTQTPFADPNRKNLTRLFHVRRDFHEGLVGLRVPKPHVCLSL